METAWTKHRPTPSPDDEALVRASREESQADRTAESVDASEQLAGRDGQSTGHTHQAGKTNISLAPLKSSNLGGVQVARSSQVFLGEPDLFAAGSYVLAEPFLGFWIRLSAATCRSSWHARMLDPSSLKLQSTFLQE
jgi:hypothetical protein